MKRLLVLYESEAACGERLAVAGITGEANREVACYLSQATDLETYRDPIRTAFVADGVEVHFFEVGEARAYLAMLLADPENCLLWNLTDGFKYYRGSFATSAAALLGAKTFGSPPQAQHLCQDKFKVTALARSLGIATPATVLCRNGEYLTPLFAVGKGQQLFVKPNTLGAKIGIYADSRCASFEAAAHLSTRIWARYGDDAVVQRYVSGFDVRVSFMDAAADGERPRTGIYRLTGVEGGEVGGAFMTMQDNWTLSASRIDAGDMGAAPVDETRLFAPRMVDLAAEALSDPRVAARIVQIETVVWRIAALMGLRDYFSFDFRIGEDGECYFLEFELCPAVTIYDFQRYLLDAYRVDLPEALRRAVMRRWVEPA